VLAVPSDDHPWINPIGGLGDQLMLSGVLKLVHDADPSRRFNLIRRTNYLAFLKGHPAIAEIGYPPKDATLARCDYWSIEQLGPGPQRAFQVLARNFGLQTPVEERLYVPGDIPEDPLLEEAVPWKKVNVVIAPGSDSPRKMMQPMIWHELTEMLKRDGMLVLQVGRMKDQRIKPAYSLLGLTSPRQLLGLIRRVNVVVSCDNFIMHAAHLMQTPAVVVWGATHNQVYGYPEQIHLQMPRACGLGEFEDCIGPSRNEGGRLYHTPCPQADKHCLDQVRPVTIYDSIRRALLT
jgi:ADP-heptose:LPS heptosyltransferase